VDYVSPRQAEFNVSLLDSPTEAQAIVARFLVTGGIPVKESEIVPLGDGWGLRFVIRSETRSEVFYGFAVDRAVSSVQVSGQPGEESDIDALARQLVSLQDDRLRAALVTGAGIGGAGEPAPYCRSGQSPAFRFAPFGLLESVLPKLVGNPLECAHRDPSNGETVQVTSTGLAYYRRSSMLPSFAVGEEHWALASDPAGLTWVNAISGTSANIHILHWIGDQLDPPDDAESLSAE